MLIVFTSRTLMPCDSYCSSSAFLISVFDARGLTRNVYRPWTYSWYVRSVMTGPITICEAERVAKLGLLGAAGGARPHGPAEVLLEELEAVLRDEDVGVREEVPDVRVAGQDDLGRAKVLEAPADHQVRRRQHDERRLVETDGVHQLGRLLRLG